MTDTSIPRGTDHPLAPAVDAYYEDSRTRALWVHKDLVNVREDWQIGPPKANEAFGDVESWAAYVTRFGRHQAPLLTWNSQGLAAVLDYHQNDGLEGGPGQLQWIAKHPFERSPEWKAWTALADGHAKGQREAIEALEDRGLDIVDPQPGDLMNILRTLRTTVNKSATTELRSDGTTSVQYSDDKGVAARGGTVDLPSEFTIAIPVLKGHVGADGKPVAYSLKVRIRASVGDNARLALRFSIPNAERALEDVFADRVAAARTALGDGFTVLRAAG